MKETFPTGNTFPIFSPIAYIMSFKENGNKYLLSAYNRQKSLSPMKFDS